MDKYSAVWLSHSSISTFKKCPRAYYLSTLYRDPRTGHKLAITSPAFALGCAVHEVLESLSILPVKDRLRTPLLERYRQAWDKYSGQKGGFDNDESEKHYYEKGVAMINRVSAHPGPLANLAVKIKMDLPHYWLSESDNLILCGKLDWLEYLEPEDSIHIIDFKTGAGEESVDSLQLPIYYLLAHNCQTKEIKKASYWYVARDDMPVEKQLPKLDTCHDLVLKVGKEIKLARQLERFKCPAGADGCKSCQPYEKILRGEATFVGEGDYHTDLYALFEDSSTPQSEIL